MDVFMGHHVDNIVWLIPSKPPQPRHFMSIADALGVEATVIFGTLSRQICVTVLINDLLRKKIICYTVRIQIGIARETYAITLL